MLMNCPFCNSDNVTIESESTGPFPEEDVASYVYHAICCDCKGRGPNKENKLNAAKSWNKRQEIVMKYEEVKILEYMELSHSDYKLCNTTKK